MHFTGTTTEHNRRGWGTPAVLVTSSSNYCWEPGLHKCTCKYLKQEIIAIFKWRRLVFYHQALDVAWSPCEINTLSSKMILPTHTQMIFFCYFVKISQWKQWVATYLKQCLWIDISLYMALFVYSCLTVQPLNSNKPLFHIVHLKCMWPLF